MCEIVRFRYPASGSVQQGLHRWHCVSDEALFVGGRLTSAVINLLLLYKFQELSFIFFQ